MTALADQLSLWGVQDGFSIFSDGSAGFGFEITPVDVASWKDTDVDAYAERLGNFLNSLPAGLDLQFVQDILRGDEEALCQNTRLKAEELSPRLESLRHSRIEVFHGKNRSGQIPRHRLWLLIRREPSPGAIVGGGWLRRKAASKVTSEFLARELQEATSAREEIARSLSALDLAPRALPDREIIEAVYAQWNPTRTVGLHTYDPDDVRSSLLFTDLLLEDRGFSLGGMHHRVLSLKGLPDKTMASMSRLLRSLPLESRLFLSIRVPDQRKEIEFLQTQRRIAFSMARGKRSGVSDVESEAKLGDLEMLITQLVTQGEKVFHVSLNVLLRSTDPSMLDEQARLALSAIRDLSGAEGMEESLASFDIFSELSLPNARGRERAKRMKTSNVSDFLPVFGAWKGHETPRVLLRSPEGGIVGFDPFASELPNYNQVVTGGSGSGKSFLANLLLLQLLKESPKVFIVDIGASYRRLCESVGGQYIPFNLSNGVSLNPFDVATGETKPSSHKIKFLVGLVEMMTKEEGTAHLTRLERADIEEAIQAVYRCGTAPSLSVLREYLSQRPEDHLRRLGKILAPWCGDTPFGQLVDRPTSLRLESSIVSFDLKGLETYPDLQSVCLYLVTEFVWGEVQRDRSAMKILVLDECWKLLENEAGAQFIGEVFRTFRKYFAGAIAISQNIDDFAKSRVAGAILPNTATKWCLTQRGADPQRLRETLGLNETELSLVNSLHQDRGRYSQAFLMAGDRHCVVAIEPSPLEYWLATTDPRDLAEIDRRAGEDSFGTLEDLAREFPQGVVSHGDRS